MCVCCFVQPSCHLTPAAHWGQSSVAFDQTHSPTALQCHPENTHKRASQQTGHTHTHWVSIYNIHRERISMHFRGHTGHEGLSDVCMCVIYPWSWQQQVRSTCRNQQCANEPEKINIQSDIYLGNTLSLLSVCVHSLSVTEAEGLDVVRSRKVTDSDFLVPVSCDDEPVVWWQSLEINHPSTTSKVTTDDNW